MEKLDVIGFIKKRNGSGELESLPRDLDSSLSRCACFLSNGLCHVNGKKNGFAILPGLQLTLLEITICFVLECYQSCPFLIDTQPRTCNK